VDEEEQIARLRALWKSGRDKFLSFFAVLAEVQAVVGDRDFDIWCISKLEIGAEAVSRLTGTLKKNDADVVRARLAHAVEFAKEERRRVAEERRRAAAEKEAVKMEEEDKRDAARVAHERKRAEMRKQIEKARATPKKKAKLLTNGGVPMLTTRDNQARRKKG
jgi:hypothetical protein